MAMYPPVTDAQITALLAGSRAGETEVVERLYDLYADRLHTYLTTRVGDPDLAADLTTDAFLRVIRYLPAFRLNAKRPAASFSAWMYRIADTVAANHWRSLGRRPPACSLDEALHADVGARPGRSLEDAEHAADLARALAELSEEQRLVIVGKFIEEMSNADIAAWLGKTEGAVKSLQYRALQTLKRVLSNRKADRKEVQARPAEDRRRVLGPKRNEDEEYRQRPGRMPAEAA
jgi:RNA polymerase sigma-70 factor, ECF subfamily